MLGLFLAIICYIYNTLVNQKKISVYPLEDFTLECRINVLGGINVLDGKKSIYNKRTVPNKRTGSLPENFAHSQYSTSKNNR